MHSRRPPARILFCSTSGFLDSDGFVVLSELRERFRQSRSWCCRPSTIDNVAKALDLGALGFIPKSAPDA